MYCFSKLWVNDLVQSNIFPVVSCLKRNSILNCSILEDCVQQILMRVVLISTSCSLAVSLQRMLCLALSSTLDTVQCKIIISFFLYTRFLNSRSQWCER